MTRRNITQPADWWRAWEQAAESAGMDLSAWIGKKVNRSLPREVRATLSGRVGRGKHVRLNELTR